MKTEPSREKLNFLLVFPDQWRGDCLGFLGHPVVETPFLDHIASIGVTFTSAYSACPSCIAARASLAAGMTPYSCGRIGYKDGVPWNYPQSMMQCLKDSGYQTMCAGKTHFYPQRLHLGFEQLRLYDTLRIEPGFESDYHSWLRKESGGSVRDTASEMDPNSWIVKKWSHPEYMHPNTWTADTAIDMLEKRDPARPFFMQLAFHRPHPPLDPPSDYFEMYKDKELPPLPRGDWSEEFNAPVKLINAYNGTLAPELLDRMRKAYYAQITHIDFQIGKVYRWLLQNGLGDNTYIIFCSDHGELLGDHNMFRKYTPHEGSAGIPFILKPPPLECAQGTFRDEPVGLMDIMPTVLEAAGIEIPRNVEGRSLGSLVRGQGGFEREYIHGEHTRSDVGWQFLTDGREKYIWDSLTGREWFFDLKNDPQENTDCLSDPRYRKKVSAWRRRLVKELSGRKDTVLSDGAKLIPGCIPETVLPGAF